MADYADLDWASGQNNMAGLQVIGYWAPVDDFETIPARKAEDFASATNGTEVIELESTTGFVFKTGKCFKKIYGTLEEGEIKDTQQGPRDGRSYKSEMPWVYPGTKKEALAWAAGVANTPMVVIGIEGNGQRRVLGTGGFPAYAKVDITTGKAGADRKGLAIVFETIGPTPAPVYEGDISLTPAV